MRVLNAILTHQPAENVDRMAASWHQGAASDEVLILYGGMLADFESIKHPHKVFIQDSRLRTKHHRLEKQSYTEVIRAIAGNLATFSHVLFAEYDLVPLQQTAVVHAAYLEKIAEQDADVLFPVVHEVQATCQEVYLPYAFEPAGLEPIRDLSTRSDRGTVLWALLPGSFWRSEALSAVAAVEGEAPVYFEIYLPTLAHHLGFRVRPLTDPRFKIFGGKPFSRASILGLRDEGSIVIHPMKDQWNGEIV